MSDATLNWSKWLLKTRFNYMTEEQKQQTLKWLLSVRDTVLYNANLKKSDTIIDLGTGTGLLGFGALDFIDNSGKVFFLDKFEDCLNACREFAKKNKITKPHDFILSDCNNIKLPANSIDKALMRSVLVHILDKKQVFLEIYKILKPGGIYSAFEPIIKSNTRCWELVPKDALSDYNDFKQAEDECLNSNTDPLTNFDETTLSQDLDSAGFSNGIIDKQIVESNYIIKPNMVKSWLCTPPSPGTKTMKEKFLTYFDEPKVDNYISELQQALENKTVSIKSNVVYIKAIK